jgi:RluA family pseudouridine synthase
VHREITIDYANAGRRLDVFVRQLLPEAPLGTVMRWIRTGAVRVSGKRKKPEARLALGDVVRVPDAGAAEPAPRRKKLPPPEVVFEDDDLLVVNKPAGLPSHPGTKHTDDSLSARIEGYLGSAGAGPGHRPGLAQRLDAGVSGLVPAGKHAAALRVLAQAVESGSIDKVYLALVDGAVQGDHGVIDVPLRVDDEPRGDRPRTHPDLAGQPSYTEYTVRERLTDASLLAVRIKTGRTHQIRAHLLSIGHPILGDPRYGNKARNAMLHETYGVDRPLLHAAELSLTHPRSGAPVIVVAPLPADFERLLPVLRRKGDRRP